MGLETTTTLVPIKKFLGLNNKYSDLTTDVREASHLQNVNINESSLETRNGSVKLHAVAFKDKTNSTAKNLTGVFECKMNNTLYQVGVGGDAFKQFSAGAWTDRTGSITITDDDDNRWFFAKFKDSGAANDIIIGANGVDAPFKWTGSGNAALLSTPPGNFNFPVVHKNKLWVAINEFLYFSAILDGESWDTVDDLVKFENNGEKITGLLSWADRLLVFQPSAIWQVSGSSNYDIYIDKTITNDGTVSCGSIQTIESRRYGNIVVFINAQGKLKAFNGSKNIIDLGDPASRTFESMAIDRWQYSVSANYKNRKQYWLGCSPVSTTTNSEVIIYDYENDYFSGDNGKPLSSILYHKNIKANAMGTWTQSSEQILVTANYTGFLLQQDSGRLDEEVDTIVGMWRSKKVDFGSTSQLKLITDLSIVTTQSTTTNATISIQTDMNSGSGTVSLAASGYIWGEFLWGSGDWVEPLNAYTRVELANSNSSDERAIFGRYFIITIYHNTANEAMITNELNLGITNLGYQAAFIET